MDAKFILEAIRAKHPSAAIVHEVVIHDHLWDERATDSKPTRRIDALMFQSLERTAIEIKVSRADFARDTWQKRAPWRAVTHRFVFAIPKGLDWLGLDTYDCGVWTVDEFGRVEVAKKATVKRVPEPLPGSVVQSLAYRAARARYEQG